jgi:hypothetical protein
MQIGLLVITDNLRTDRCTVHQWLTKFFLAGAVGASQKTKINSQEKIKG